MLPTSKSRSFISQVSRAYNIFECVIACLLTLLDVRYWTASLPWSPDGETATSETVAVTVVPVAPSTPPVASNTLLPFTSGSTVAPHTSHIGAIIGGIIGGVAALCAVLAAVAFCLIRKRRQARKCE